MLASLRSVQGLAHSLRSLPRGTVVIPEYVFTLKSCFTGTIEILVVTRNTPLKLILFGWEDVLLCTVKKHSNVTFGRQVND